MTDLRADLIEAGARARYERMVERMVAAAAPKLMILPDWGELDAEDRQAQIETSGMYFDALLDALAENAIPLYDMGGISSSFVIDDDPDEDTIWVVDLAVLREDRP